MQASSTEIITLIGIASSFSDTLPCTIAGVVKQSLPSCVKCRRQQGIGIVKQHKNSYSTQYYCDTKYDVATLITTPSNAEKCCRRHHEIHMDFSSGVYMYRCCRSTRLARGQGYCAMRRYQPNRSLQSTRRNVACNCQACLSRLRSEYHFVTDGT